MATCPECGTSSRIDPTAMTLAPILQAKPVGAYSLAGVMMKAPVRLAYRLACRCGWTVTGQIESNQFVVDPTTTEG